MGDELHTRRLIWVALLSPILGIMTGILSAIVLPVLLFPLARAGAVLQVLGFAAYGWVAGRIAGRFAGVAVLIGLGGSLGLAVVMTRFWQVAGAGFPVAVMIVDVAVASVLAEVAGRRPSPRRDRTPS